MHIAILYAPDKWAEWKSNGGSGKPPFDPIAVLPTWSDAALIEDIMPGAYVVIERMYDRVKPTHQNGADFLSAILGDGKPVREADAGRWTWEKH
ncbi:MAG TPA: hypothetical protein VFW46_20155 [Stellaceae bacterium]|nr:hypothetical protein [Stellaceae bacterium]